MEKLKKFKNFIKEIAEYDDNINDFENNLKFNDEPNFDDVPTNLDDDDVNDIENSEPEEITDLIEIKYNKKNDEWEIIDSELSPPTDFDSFYDWFNDEINSSPTSSMKEEDDEVYFYMPENDYITYFDEIENDETENDDINDDDIEIDDDY